MNACPPVGLFIFNRPECARQVVAALRRARPARVFVVADGPRAGVAGEAAACAAARAVAEEGIDWPCAVTRDYAEENLGCARRVSSGLDRIFAQVEAAIVLEDDCVPDDGFFPYCGELLERFREDPRVGVIGGSNFQPRDVTGGAGYYFSDYPHCWGWATWRRAWRAYDHDMGDWPAAKRAGWPRTKFAAAREALFWTRVLDRVFSGEIDSWAYRWAFACWRKNFLTVLPATGLVTNIGFDGAATHTRRVPAGVGQRSWPQPWPLRHPAGVARNARADRHTFEHHFHPTPTVRLRRIIARVLGAR
jgi:hypothetical protein